MSEAGPRRLFPRTVLDAVADGKMIRIRAGTDHRFTGVWVVVVRGRVFVRSWNDKAQGWYRAFVNEPRGAMQFLGRQIPVRARRTRGDRLLDAIDLAYGEKYNTRASQKWVRGFRTTGRRMTSMELVPD